MRRRRSRKRPSFFQTTVACAFLTVTALAPWALHRYGPRLPMRVKELKVFTGQMLSDAQVKVLAGVREGDPLFGSQMKKAMANLQANPRVDGVSVVRNMTGDVVIKVAERKAAALANFDELYSIDAAGHVLGRANLSSPEAIDRVVLTGPWSGRVPKENWSEEFQEGVRLIGTMVLAGLKEKEISELHYDSGLGWVVYRVGFKTRLVMGRDEFKTKMIRLKRILSDFTQPEKQKRLREIDLDFRNQAIVKLDKTT